MKKNLLSLAVAAGAAGITSVASAQMYLNSEGTGEALIFPFYSVQSGNDTYIHVVNTMDQTKAVKIRVIESVDSQETLDFNLYMSPYDHFAFAITVDGDGAKLITKDTSCTVPAIPEGGQGFSTLLWADDPATDKTDRVAEEKREQVGYIEVIEMGQIKKLSKTAKSVLHGTSGDKLGIPADCTYVNKLWTDGGTAATKGAWYTEAGAQNVGTAGAVSVGTTDMETTWQGGGLYGVATVINVQEGTAFGYEARAIEDLVDSTENGVTGSILHYPPGDTRPDFNDGAMSNTAHVNVNGVQTTYTKSLTENHSPVSAVFMTGSIKNDYVVDSELNSLTDWIINFPTKSNHKKNLLLTQPFSNKIAGKDITELCQPVSVTGYDREEQTQDPPAAGTDGPAFSPSTRPEDTPTPDLLICNEVTVAHFGSASATNTTADIKYGLANISAYVDGWAAGWAVMDFRSGGLNNALSQKRELNGTVAGTAEKLAGLPVTGFAVVEYTNGVADGNVRNYQQAWDHKTDVVTSDT